MKKFTGLLFAVVFLIASSCQKSENLMPDKSGESIVSESSLIKVVDGRLVFANKVVYDETMKYLVEHQGALDAWERQFKGYISMRTAFATITTKQYEEMIEGGHYDQYAGILTVIPSGNEKELVINIEDQVASTVVNNQGLVQIGTNVFKIGYEKVVKFDHFATGMELNQYINSDPSKGITISKVNRSRYSSPNARQALGEDNRLAEYWVGSSKRRLIGTVYSWQWGLVDNAHIGLQTKHQRRFLGAWFAESISNIGLSGSGSYQVYHNGIPEGPATSFSTGTRELSYDNYINYTLQYAPDTSYEYIYTYVTSRHYGTGTDNNPHEVNF